LTESTREHLDGEIQAHLSALLVAQGSCGGELGRALLGEALHRAGGLRMHILTRNERLRDSNRQPRPLGQEGVIQAGQKTGKPRCSTACEAVCRTRTGDPFLSKRFHGVAPAAPQVTTPVGKWCLAFEGHSTA
jgi:hypothetical protein